MDLPPLGFRYFLFHVCLKEGALFWTQVAAVNGNKVKNTICLSRLMPQDYKPSHESLKSYRNKFFVICNLARQTLLK
jgi:hypothetical protein